MHVYHLTNSFWPFLGGAEQVVGEMARLMIRQGVTTSVVTRYRRGLRRQEQVAGVPTFRVGVEPKRFAARSEAAIACRTFSGAPRARPASHLLSSMAFAVHAAWWLATRRCRRSLVHLHSIDAPLLAALLVRLLGRCRLVTTLHGELNVLRLQRGKARRLGSAALRRLSDGVIVLNEVCHRQLREDGYTERQLLLIPNGVDCERFTPGSAANRQVMRQQYGIDQKALMVLFVGKLYDVKRPDLLLEAFARLDCSQQAAHLVIAGDGPDRVATEAQARRQGVADRVHLLGHIDDVLPSYRAADLFVLPSSTEGISISLLEAMACGLAVVASDIPSNRQVVRSGIDGLTFVSGSAESLVMELNRLATDQTLRVGLGEAARRRVLDRFSLDMVVAAHLELYRRLLGGDPG